MQKTSRDLLETSWDMLEMSLDMKETSRDMLEMSFDMHSDCQPEVTSRPLGHVLDDVTV